MKPGTSSLVSMKVSRTVTSQKALKYFDSDQRMCYTQQEFQPLYFNEVLFLKLFFTSPVTTFTFYLVIVVVMI